ncbi:hypothetical protein D3C80_1698050 [compost metagenome]
MRSEEQVHQVTGQRHQAGVTVSALIVGEVIDLRVAWKVVAPYRLAGKPGRVRVTKQQIAHFGEQTIGPHHQVITTAAAVGEQHVDAVILVIQGFYAESKAYFGAQFQGRFTEDFMQCQA